MYLREFVQHHINIGFHQVAIGLQLQPKKTSLELQEDWKFFHDSRKALQPYLQRGWAILVPLTLGEFFCGTDKLKLPFYNMALYHYKGLAKYIAIWDIDEYWLPTHPDDNDLLQSYHQPSSSRSVLVSQDPLWQESNYSKTLSISQVTQAIENYHAMHGCSSDEDWCFHGFPAFKAFARRPSQTNGQWLQQRFELRDKDRTFIRRKSISKTHDVFLKGLHEPGSCRGKPMQSDEHGWLPTYLDPGNPKDFSRRRTNPFPAEYQLSRGHNATFTSSNSKAHCIRGFVMEGFGDMHHFGDLFTSSPRWEPTSNESVVPDEYIHSFSQTVMDQIARLDSWN